MNTSRAAVRCLSLLAGASLLLSCEKVPDKIPGLDTAVEEPPVNLGTVGAGMIFAGEFDSGSMTWWIVDESSGAITQTGTHTSGNVVVTLDGAAGAYVTTPSTVTSPGYSVQFEGEVAEGGVFSYLETEEDSFEDLRLSDGSTMATKHAEMMTHAQTLVDTFEADLETVKEQLTEQIYTLTDDARAELACAAAVLMNSTDVDLIESGGADVADWVADLEAMTVTLENETAADAAIAEGNALTASALIPDETSTQEALEDCLEVEDWAYQIEDSVDKLFSEAIADEEWTYDGRRAESGEITDGDWASMEDSLADYLDSWEGSLEGLETCLESAYGGEPTLVYDDILPDPYEALGADATTLGEDLELEIEACLASLDALYADIADVDSPGGDLDPAAWAAAEAHAMATLEAMIGPDLLGEDDGGTTAEEAEEARETMEDSSYSACENTSFTFQINVLGLGVAIGTPFDDVIRGKDDETGFEVMVGLGGDDCINGLKGHELIIGGSGDDELHGGDQHEILLGNSGDDILYAGEGEDYSFTIPLTPPVTVTVEIGSLLFGGADSDDLYGADPDYDETDTSHYGYTDIMFGDAFSEDEAGDDWIDGGGGVDLLFGQWGDDTVRNIRPGRFQISVAATKKTKAVTKDLEMGSFFFGGKDDDTLEGSSSFDLHFGNTDDDTIQANEGIDLVFGSSGDDIIDGGPGILDLVFGGQGDDESYGGDGIDLVMGNAGDDTVRGGGGALDLVFGNDGSDLTRGDDGIDLVFGGPGMDFVYGDDSIDLVFGGSDKDTVYGGSGIDMVFGNSDRDQVEGGEGIDLIFGNGDTDILRGNDGIDVIFGGDGEDWISGDDGIDLIWSNGEDDALFGGGAIDVLFGSEGNDCFWGEDGMDLIFGGEGDDGISGGPQLDLVFGNDGDDVLSGDDGTDLIWGGSGEDGISGGGDVDLLWGGDGEDLVFGGDALDLLFGGSDADCLEGDAGFDVITGGDGDDSLLSNAVAFGGSGLDVLETDLVAFGGDDDDSIGLTGAYPAALFGNSGADHIHIADAAGTTLVFGNSGDDILTASGATSTSLSASKRYLFGNSDNDWIQASNNKSRAFGNSGDDVLCGDADGSSSNDDHRDWLFGNRDEDLLIGDDSSKRDLMLRGGGNDPARDWDALPSTSPNWSIVHTAPSFDSCDPMPLMSCEDAKNPPEGVGAVRDGG